MAHPQPRHDTPELRLRCLTEFPPLDGTLPKRTRIRAYEETEVARIRAAEKVLQGYFEQVFAERRGNFEQLFSRLDDALEKGNGEATAVVLQSIVDIARTSPLADLGDLSQIRAALDDPDQVWDL